MLTQPVLWCLSYVHILTHRFNFNLFLLHDPNFRLPLFLLTTFKILSPWTRAISLKSTPLIMLMDHHPLTSISAQPPFQLESPYPGRLSSICLTISVEAFLRVLMSWLSFELFRAVNCTCAAGYSRPEPQQPVVLLDSHNSTKILLSTDCNWWKWKLHTLLMCTLLHLSDLKVGISCKY